MQATRSRLLIVDGHAYAYRAFHAIRDLKSPSGEPTNCIYGFIKMLAKMESKVEPTHLVVVWDAGLSSERVALLPGYKAQRPEAPVGLHEQVGQLQDWLPCAGRASLAMDGCEADDVIAGVARTAVADGVEVVIASSDKDFMQLVGPAVRLLNPNDKTETLWQAEQVVEKVGVSPGQVVDYLSLLGDSVDNIPGAPGVGPKTAVSLLNEFGSLDGVLSAAPSMKPGRIRDSLLANADNLIRNRALIRLEPLGSGLPIDQFRLAEPYYARLGGMYAAWGFNSLRQDVEQKSGHRKPEQTLLSV